MDRCKMGKLVKLNELCWETKEEKCIVLGDEKTHGARHAQIKLINKSRGKVNGKKLADEIRKMLS